MKKLLKNYCAMSVAALLLFPMVAFGQRTVTIKGNVKFIENDFKVGVYRFSGTLKQLLAETTVDPTTHKYTMSVPVDKIGDAMVVCGDWQAVNVWLQDEDMDIDFRGVDTAAIKIKNPPFVYIKGGINNELMNLLNFDAYRNYQSMIVYSQKTYVTKFADEENQKSLTNALYDFMGDDYDARCRYYVEHYADRPSVMVAIEQLDYEKIRSSLMMHWHDWLPYHHKLTNWLRNSTKIRQKRRYALSVLRLVHPCLLLNANRQKVRHFALPTLRVKCLYSTSGPAGVDLVARKYLILRKYMPISKIKVLSL